MRNAFCIHDAMGRAARPKLDGHGVCDPVDAATEIIFAPFLDALEINLLQI